MTNSCKTVSKPSRYGGLDRQYIGGTWRPGGAGRTLRDSDPYTGETLAEIGLANQNDVD
jgi:aldehyde dehydrogenase (NAD+)